MLSCELELEHSINIYQAFLPLESYEMILDTLNHGHLEPRVSGDFYYLTRARLIVNTHSRHSSDNADGLSTAPLYLNSQLHSCPPPPHLHLHLLDVPICERKKKP